MIGFWCIMYRASARVPSIEHYIFIKDYYLTFDLLYWFSKHNRILRNNRAHGTHNHLNQWPDLDFETSEKSLQNQDFNLYLRDGGDSRYLCCVNPIQSLGNKWLYKRSIIIINKLLIYHIFQKFGLFSSDPLIFWMSVLYDLLTYLIVPVNMNKFWGIK